MGRTIVAVAAVAWIGVLAAGCAGSGSSAVVAADPDRFEDPGWDIEPPPDGGDPDAADEAPAGRRVFAADRAQLEFGNVVIGDTGTAVITVRNGGVDGFYVQRFEWTSPTPPAAFAGEGFTVGGSDSSKLLAAGESATYTFRFRPSSKGSFTAEVAIRNTSDNAPFFRIGLVGRGVEREAPRLGLGPGPLIDFGDVPVGSDPFDRELRILNQGTGSTALEVYEAAADAADTDCAAFTVAYDRPSPAEAGAVSLVPGADPFVVSMRFLPAAVRAYACTFVVRTNSSVEAEQRVEVQLTGKGVPADLEIRPNPIDFRAVALGTSRKLFITGRNVSSTPLQVYGADVLRVPAPEAYDLKSDAANTNVTLAPGAEVVWELTFRPTQRGPADGFFSVNVNRSNQPLLLTAVKASGGDVDTRPIAIITDAPGNPPLRGPIDVTVGQTVSLTGASSRAGSGTITGYDWRLNVPAGSGAEPAPSAAAAAVRVTFDLAGSYNAILVVTDSSGVTSAPTQVGFRAFADDQLRIEFGYAPCSGDQRAQIAYLPVNHSLPCSWDTANATTGMCKMRPEDGYGQARMVGSRPTACPSSLGNSDVIEHTGIKSPRGDGTYRIEVRYLEDCASRFIIGNFCTDRGPTTGRLRLYRVGQSGAFWSTNVEFREKGTRSFLLRRVNGRFDDNVTAEP